MKKEGNFKENQYLSQEKWARQIPQYLPVWAARIEFEAKVVNLQPQLPLISYNEQIAQLKALETGFDRERKNRHCGTARSVRGGAGRARVDRDANGRQQHVAGGFHCCIR